MNNEPSSRNVTAGTSSRQKVDNHTCRLLQRTRAMDLWYRMSVSDVSETLCGRYHTIHNRMYHTIPQRYPCSEVCQAYRNFSLRVQFQRQSKLIDTHILTHITSALDQSRCKEKKFKAFVLQSIQMGLYLRNYQLTYT